MEDHVLHISADASEMVNKTIIIMPEQAFRQQFWNYFTLGGGEKTQNKTPKPNPQHPPPQTTHTQPQKANTQKNHYTQIKEIFSKTFDRSYSRNSNERF